MSIHLHAEANDLEVENLLAYLDSQSDLAVEEKISLLERTTKWLCASRAIGYSLSPDQGLIRLSVDAIAPMSLLNPDKQVLRHEARQISQEAHK